MQNKRGRWTVLDVDEHLIRTVKRFAKKNGYTSATALKVLVEKGMSK